MKLSDAREFAFLATMAAPVRPSSRVSAPEPLADHQ